MKSGKILSTVLVLTILASALAGCGFNQNKGEGSSAVVSSQSTPSSAPESGTSASESASSLSSVAGVSSSLPNQPTTSQNGPVIPVQTDDKEFNEKFAQNPIDKAYIKDSAKAVSTVDMVNVSNKYAVYWQMEIGHAYSELTNHMKTDSSDKPKQLIEEQKKWESSKSDALKKISEEEQATGGSMAQVNAASQVMDFYRTRAAQIYRELYEYDKNYTYAYSENKK
ncbi:MAG TPA: DUF1311 domain-containing protein [Clostridiales bacterium]|jgi:uncharacterized protein YecT (DUF1311 family)|nr:DUF1311 domain-containing protein [Clostridiales bacterium]